MSQAQGQASALALPNRLVPGSKIAEPGALGFAALTFFLFLEYIRPPGLVLLRLQFLFIISVPIAWVMAGSPRWNRVLTLQTLYFAWCAFGIVHAYNYFAVYIVSRVIYGNVVIGLTFCWLLSTRKQVARLVWVWMALMAYIGLYTITHGGVGPGGFIGDENDVALGVCTALPFALFGLERLPGWRRWVSAALCAIMVIAIVVSLSRGGFVALLAVGAYCLATSRRKLLNASVVLLTVLLFALFIPAKYVEEIQSISNTNEGTAKTRRYLWATALAMFEAKPLTGVGGENYHHLVGQYQPRTGDWPDDWKIQNWSGFTVHSLYFETLAEQGLVGSGLFLMLATNHFRSMRRLRRMTRGRADLDESLKRDVEIYSGGLSGAMVGFLSAGAFLSVSYYPYFWYFTALAAAFEHAVNEEVAAADAETRDSDPVGERESDR